MRRFGPVRSPLMLAQLMLVSVSACLLLTACGGDKKAVGNTVQMRDMEVVDGTVNDSMTDLDAVKSDGVGVVENAGSVTRAQSTARAENGSGEDTETVATE